MAKLSNIESSRAKFILSKNSNKDLGAKVETEILKTLALMEIWINPQNLTINVDQGENSHQVFCSNNIKITPIHLKDELLILIKIIIKHLFTMMHSQLEGNSEIAITQAEEISNRFYNSNNNSQHLIAMIYTWKLKMLLQGIATRQSMEIWLEILNSNKYQLQFNKEKQGTPLGLWCLSTIIRAQVLLTKKWSVKIMKRCHLTSSNKNSNPLQCQVSNRRGKPRWS